MSATIAPLSPASGPVAAFTREAGAAARALGHDLRPFTSTAGMLAASSCTRCGRSAGMMLDGSPVPAATATTVPCPNAPDAPRYYVRRASRGARHYVLDRTRPALAPVDVARTAAAAGKLAAALNAPAAPVAVAGEPPADLAGAIRKARAKVARAETALGKARAALDELLDAEALADLNAEHDARQAAAAAPAWAWDLVWPLARMRRAERARELRAAAPVVVTVDVAPRPTTDELVELLDPPAAPCAAEPRHRPTGPPLVRCADGRVELRGRA